MIIIWTNLVDLESSMLYTKIQPQGLFGSGEEDFKCFYHIWHGGHFVWWCGTIWSNWQYPSDRRSYEKSGKIAQTFSEKKTFKTYTILYMYIAQGQMQITIWEQNYHYN